MMPEHKTNPDAVLQSMLPALLPFGYGCLVQMRVEVVPAAGILLYPAEHMRVVESGFEVQPFGSEEWIKPPEGVRLVHPIGQPLAPENCDVVILVGTAVQDGRERGILTAAGASPRFRTSHVMQGELGRMPLVEWQKLHLGQLRAQVS